MVTSVQNFLNGSSKSMNVNGSVTPQVFTFTASANSAILGFTCLLKNNGATDLNKFGTLTKLSNGILIQTTMNSVTSNITTLKDNADLCTRFPFNQFGNSAVLSLLGVATSEGFGNSNNIFMGFLDLTPPHLMTLSPGDTVTVTIQDNLSTIDILEMSIKFCID